MKLMYVVADQLIREGDKSMKNEMNNNTRIAVRNINENAANAGNVSGNMNAAKAAKTGSVPGNTNAAKTGKALQSRRTVGGASGKTRRRYTEVNVDAGGFEKFWKDPMTRNYQYEYAMYEVVSGLFASVRCRSMCLESLKLFFWELPNKQENEDQEQDNVTPGAKKSKYRQDILGEISYLVNRDVIGHVTFPMMSSCQAEVRIVREENRKHRFIFTDGVYGFSLILYGQAKHPERIKVMPLYPDAAPDMS